MIDPKYKHLVNWSGTEGMSGVELQEIIRDATECCDRYLGAAYDMKPFFQHRVKLLFYVQELLAREAELSAKLNEATRELALLRAGSNYTAVDNPAIEQKVSVWDGETRSFVRAIVECRLDESPVEHEGKFWVRVAGGEQWVVPEVFVAPEKPQPKYPPRPGEIRPVVNDFVARCILPGCVEFVVSPTFQEASIWLTDHLINAHQFTGKFRMEDKYPHTEEQKKGKANDDGSMER